MQISLLSIPNALETRVGLPRPDWAIIQDWMSSNVADADLDDAWTTLASDWIDQLIEALPDGYSRRQSREFFLLSSSAESTDERILQWCEDSRETILKILAGVARDEGHGKHVVFAFADAETYYDYVSDFYPDDGEFGLSVGMFLDSGYGHLVMCMAYEGEHDRTIAHELNHALLRHLPLPLWLNEGVTQVIEDLVVGSSHFHVDREMSHRHRTYWNANTIQSFWSGDSFDAPDDGQELSYHLAEILFRNLMSDYPKQIHDFLKKADFVDAGNQALLDSCDATLQDRVAQFLGEGEWSPRADYAESDVPRRRPEAKGGQF